MNENSERPETPRLPAVDPRQPARAARDGVPTPSAQATGPALPPGGRGPAVPPGPVSPAAPPPPADTQVTLRGPAELADALPYLLGFFPDDSIVMVAVHGERGRFGGRVRLGIPTDPAQWDYVAEQMAACLITATEARGDRPDGVIAFLCQDPADHEAARTVMRRLQPLAQRLRTACGARDVPVLEALCLSGGRYWSYCCPDHRCCPPEGTRLSVPGTSVMAATATYAGVRVRGSLRELEARLAPLTGRRAHEQEKALDAAAAALLPRMLDVGDTDTVREETMGLLRAVLARFEQDVPAGSRRARDACDDALLAHGESAQLVIGLQDRLTRDHAARWMEGPVAAPALRLWRALARRCVGGFVEHAAAPLTLAGWVAWSCGDEPSARIALARAMTVDPHYVFARLLHQGLNEGLDPEAVRACVRTGDPTGWPATSPWKASGGASRRSAPARGRDAGAGRGPCRPRAPRAATRPPSVRGGQAARPVQRRPRPRPATPKTPGATVRPAPGAGRRGRPRTGGERR